VPETTRKRLRDLVRFIEESRRQPVDFNIEGDFGAENPVELPAAASPVGFERFREQARAFLKSNEDHPAIRKLRANERLTLSGLADLERMLVESRVGGSEEIEKAKAESHGLELFVRLLVGLDREAAKRTLAGFVAETTLGANQIEIAA
jgi:type I restriction enzyme R subunit